MWKSFFDYMNGTVAAVGRMQEATLTAALRGAQLTNDSYARLWGLDREAVLEGDKRFEDSAWRENLPVDVLKQAYLITARWMEEYADSLEAVDPQIHQQTKFWTQQIADVFSPANFLLTNPVAMQETIRTGGKNLAIGMQNLWSDLQSGRITQVPEDAFEVGVDLATTPGEVIYRNQLIELIQYSPTSKRVYQVPILAIPPWINKYYVMDLSPNNSLYRYLIESGFTVFTISWKNPDESILDLEWDDYIDLGPLDALRVIKDVTGSEQVNTIGYCLGGIIQQLTLSYLTRIGDQTVNSATYFATHQDFSKAGDITVFISEPGVRGLEWLMELSGGYLDGRNMAATFNMMRANDLLWNYVVNNYLMGKQPPSFDLLYWNNDGTRVPGKVHSFLLREFFLENRLKEPNGISVKGGGVDLSQITTPSYTVGATADHIVPWQGEFLMRELQGGTVRFILTTGGHIAGIINPPEENKRDYWTNDNPTSDPDEWLKGATNHQGSWWPDWIDWLKQYSGKKVAPPAMGNEEYQPITSAPGTYVLEK